MPSFWTLTSVLDTESYRSNKLSHAARLKEAGELRKLQQTNPRFVELLSSTQVYQIMGLSVSELGLLLDGGRPFFLPMVQWWAEKTHQFNSKMQLWNLTIWSSRIVLNHIEAVPLSTTLSHCMPLPLALLHVPSIGVGIAASTFWVITSVESQELSGGYCSIRNFNLLFKLGFSDMHIARGKAAFL